jgi:hypothetical protein
MSAPISRARRTSVGVAVDLVAAAGRGRLHHQRLDHQRHAVAVAVGAHARDVLHALAEQVGLIGQHEEVDHHAGRVALHGRQHRVVLVLQLGPHHAVQRGVVGIAHVDAHHQRGLAAARAVLQQVGLAVVELDRVGAGGQELLHDLGHVFQAVEEGGLVAHAVVQGDVQAATVGEQAVEPRCLVFRHGKELLVGDRKKK